MGRTELTAKPYEYAGVPHQRRHGPAGYADYKRYRPWLKDEFCFRCVYCLKRMVWSPTDIWVIDHLVSREEAPELECEYENLVLACQFCNNLKDANRVPDPCQVAYGRYLRVEEDGTVTALDGPGRRLVSVLRLNHELQVQERKKVLCLMACLERCDRAQFERLMGFPADLPDLRKTKPPENRLPAGINDCWFVRRERGDLPTVY
jgi:hypothetical protein